VNKAEVEKLSFAFELPSKFTSFLATTELSDAAVENSMVQVNHRPELMSSIQKLRETIDVLEKREELLEKKISAEQARAQQLAKSDKKGTLLPSFF
jgi:hypothetical protein